MEILTPRAELNARGTFREPGIRELEHLLAYETLYKNGTQTLTEVQLQHMRNTSFSSLATLSCRKRQVYGTDGRFVIADQRFITSFPFSASVKLSAGCSLILVSPKHVLTAAHGVHDGHRYRRGLKRLRVGAMALRKNRRRKDKLDGESRRKQMKRAGKRENQSKRKTVKNSKQPALCWTRVQQTYVPRGWINDSGKQVDAGLRLRPPEAEAPDEAHGFGCGSTSHGSTSRVLTTITQDRWGTGSAR